jgi:hypothetical protein
MSSVSYNNALIKENFMKLDDVDDASLTFESQKNFRSYRSRGLPSLDIPEIKMNSFDVKFVYNYYTVDERVRTAATPEEQLLNLESNTSNEILFQATNDRLPRFIKGSFQPASDIVFNPDFVDNEGNSLSDSDALNVINNLDKIVVEGASSTRYFSGTELLDTMADKKFYDLAEASQVIQNIAIPEDSSIGNADRLIEKIAGDTLQGEQKKLLRQVLGNLQPAGFSFAPSDTRVEDAQTAFDNMARQTFSIKFNNLFFNDVTSAATRQNGSVFEDEFRAYQDVSSTIQQNAITNLTPQFMRPDEYEFGALPIKVESIPTLQLSDAGLPLDAVYGIVPKMKLSGYIVQRYEVLGNGSLSTLEPLIINNPAATFFIDKNIRYGATYLYKIRTIATIQTISKKINPYRPELTQYVKATYLIASEGRIAACHATENRPPPPPADINFKFDYSYRKPRIFWSFPINPQRDIMRFQVFKRNSIDKPFKLLVEYNFDQSVYKSPPLENALSKKIVKMKHPLLSFVDQTYEDGSTPIYAIAAIDARGLTSGYSAQFSVYYDKFTNELKTKLISREGAPKTYPNVYLNEDTFQDLIKSSGKDRMTVVFDPEYYIVRKTAAESLTGQNEGNAFSVPIVEGMQGEEDLNFIASNDDIATYKIQIINTDLQQSELIDIKIVDKSSPPIQIPAAAISKNNLSFEFGVR